MPLLPGQSANISVVTAAGTEIAVVRDPSSFDGLIVGDIQAAECFSNLFKSFQVCSSLFKSFQVFPKTVLSIIFYYLLISFNIF